MSNATITLDGHMLPVETNDQKWDALIHLGVSESILRVVTSINGYSDETLKDVLYATTGYRNFDQLDGLDDVEVFA